jgi:AcrR family transcriptional regulator
MFQGGNMPPIREITKQAVLDAALEIVREEGLPAVTARSVAARLHCSTQPIYSLFSGMPELAQAVCEQALQAAMTAINSHRDDGMPPELQPVLGLFTLAREQPGLYRAVFLSGYPKGPQALAQMAPTMLQAHRPKSQRLSSLSEERFAHVTRMVSVFVAGLGLVSMEGQLPVEEAKILTEDMYRMAVTDQLMAQSHQEREN